MVVCVWLVVCSEAGNKVGSTSPRQTILPSFMTKILPTSICLTSRFLLYYRNATSGTRTTVVSGFDCVRADSRGGSDMSGPGDVQVIRWFHVARGPPLDSPRPNYLCSGNVWWLDHFHLVRGYGHVTSYGKKAFNFYPPRKKKLINKNQLNNIYI